MTNAQTRAIEIYRATMKTHGPVFSAVGAELQKGILAKAILDRMNAQDDDVAATKPIADYNAIWEAMQDMYF